MLKRIRIKNYKSLKDVEVELTPLCVLFGPNAAGKSNFLDAMQLLSRIVCAPSIKSAFDPGRTHEIFIIFRYIAAVA